MVKELFNQHPELLETDDHASEALYSHVIETSATEMSYIDIYSFYYSNADYLLTLERIHSNSTVEGGCGWWCLLGCGSDWGCCGNYSGCCLAANQLCWLHDAYCTECIPKDVCLRGCIPDSKIKEKSLTLEK